MRLIGISFIALAFTIAVFVGLFLAFYVDDELNITIVAGLAFCFITPLALYGIFLYVRDGKDDNEEEGSLVLKQRELMDMLVTRGKMQINEAAIKLHVSQNDIEEMIHQLIGLQIFRGFVNWDDGFVCAITDDKLRHMISCEICEFPIDLTEGYKSVCKICKTEYFVL